MCVSRIQSLSSCLMTHQPLWVILCPLPKKGRKGIGEWVVETKEKNRGEWWKMRMTVRNRRNTNKLLYPTYYKYSTLTTNYHRTYEHQKMVILSYNCLKEPIYLDTIASYWIYSSIVTFWLCWGLTTRHPWGSFCVVSQRKGRKEIEERVEEMKERDREERGTGMKVKKQKK